MRAVRDWKTLTSVSEIRSFMGLASYYRRFIKNFARIAQPLMSLTRKDVPYVWSEPCARAFEQLKLRLTTAPVLFCLRSPEVS